MFDKISNSNKTTRRFAVRLLPELSRFSPCRIFWQSIRAYWQKPEWIGLLFLRLRAWLLFWEHFHGFYSNLPIAQAPGMGLNSFFAFSVVLGLGYSWQMALTAVFIEGIIFIALTFFNVREMIVNSIPKSIKDAIPVGIGLFIALIGMKMPVSLCPIPIRWFLLAIWPILISGLRCSG